MTSEQIDDTGFACGKRWADSAELDSVARVLAFGHCPEQIQTTPAARLASIVDPSAVGSPRSLERALDTFWPRDVSRESVQTGLIFAAAFCRGTRDGYAERRARQQV